MRAFVITGLAVALLLCVAACSEKSSDFIREHEAELLSVSLEADSVEADGKSTLAITARIFKDADLKTVTFKTNRGKFTDSSVLKKEAVLENGELVAKAYLVPANEVTDRVNVTISVPKIDKAVVVRFVKAYAEKIKLESGVTVIAQKMGSTIPLELYLSRSTGVPSLYQKIDSFHVLKENGAPLLHDFIYGAGKGSDADGLIKSTFVLKDTSYNGRVRIIPFLQGKGKVLTDTLPVFIIN